MSTRLSQIIAVEKGVKSDTARQFTDLHHKLQKPDLLAGLSRTYQPLDDAGTQLPPESKKVQVSAEDALGEAAELLTRLFDVTLTREHSNTYARADVTVDGQVILSSVPVGYLLFLEKQLTDLHTFTAKLPVLDPAEDWQHDQARGCWVTAPARTTRSKKVIRTHVAHPPTPEHPAQIVNYNEDVPEGEWTLVKLSGALPAPRVRTLLARVTKLQEAVKYARAEANSTEITDLKAGEAVFGYLFAV